MLFWLRALQVLILNNIWFKGWINNHVRKHWKTEVVSKKKSFPKVKDGLNEHISRIQ